MTDALEMIESGEVHEAGHIIETMLAGIEQNTLDEPIMHLKLALSSVRVEEPATAAHHLEHYLGLDAGQKNEAGEEILDSLLGDKLLEAEHGIEQLLGGGPTDDADAHDDAEEEEGHDDSDGA